jgi:nitrite reductase/ring-hydroxylating ferredoxin subunit
MIMVRGKDRKVHVLYNRCPHRGNMMCGDRTATPASSSAARTTLDSSTTTAS